MYFFFFQYLYQRLPFDEKTLTGYLITVAIEWVMVVWYAFFMGAVAGHGVGCYLIVAAIIRDINHTLQLINKSSKAKKNHSQSMKYLLEFIEMHSTVKKLSESYSMQIDFEKLSLHTLFL